MSVQHYGLFNQGATCYLNSVLQVLYMTKDFTAEVERHTRENPDNDCIDRHLNNLFQRLNGAPADTHEVTMSLGIDRVNEPRDAAECFEKILGLTSNTASEIFRGQLTHKMICSGCHKETDTDGAFWHLPLALVDSYSSTYSVVNGIEEYFGSSDFSGENQMYCDQCDAKSDATIECVMKHHPEVLMLLLKRFEFDYKYMTYVKDNRSVDVPFTLQISQNQIYELYAFVEHVGDLWNGHYTATIKADKGWHRFNDNWVTLVDPQPFQGVNIMISGSAYLLFYRKQNAVDCRELSTPPGSPPFSDITDECPHTAEMGERQEAEVAAEMDDDPALLISRNGITGTEDMVSNKLPHLHKQDEMSDAQGSVRSVKTDKDEKPLETLCTTEEEFSESTDECPHTAEMGERQEAEVAAEVDADPALLISRNDITGTEDMVSNKLPHLHKQDEMSDAQGSVRSVKTDKDEKPLETLCTTEEEFSESTDECPHTAEMGERQEAEVAAEVDADPALLISRNDITGTEDMVSNKLPHLHKQDEMSDAQGSVRSVKTDKDEKPLETLCPTEEEFSESTDECPHTAEMGERQEAEVETGAGDNPAVMILQEEIRPANIKRSVEEKSLKTDNIREETVSLEGHYKRNVKRKLDPQSDATLSNSLRDLNLSESTLPKRQRINFFFEAHKSSAEGKETQKTMWSDSSFEDTEN